MSTQISHLKSATNAVEESAPPDEAFSAPVNSTPDHEKLVDKIMTKLNQEQADADDPKVRFAEVGEEEDGQAGNDVDVRAPTSTGGSTPNTASTPSTATTRASPILTPPKLPYSDLKDQVRGTPHVSLLETVLKMAKTVVLFAGIFILLNSAVVRRIACKVPLLATAAQGGVQMTVVGNALVGLIGGALLAVAVHFA